MFDHLERARRSRCRFAMPELPGVTRREAMEGVNITTRFFGKETHERYRGSLGLDLCLAKPPACEVNCRELYSRLCHIGPAGKNALLKKNVQRATEVGFGLVESPQTRVALPVEHEVAAVPSGFV